MPNFDNFAPDPEQSSMAFSGTLSGVVKKWVREKNFGFVLESTDQSEVFVAKADITNAKRLAPGDHVTFDKVHTGRGHGGYKAIHVTLISAARDENAGFGGLFADVPGGAEDASAYVDDVAGGDCLSSFLGVAGEPSGRTASSLEPFVLKSSLGCGFLVVSAEQLVEGVKAPTGAELECILECVGRYVAECEASGAVMLADFEGEMPGHGGVLSLAQLQQTHAVDARTLTPSTARRGQGRAMGLLINLECSLCKSLLARIMESPRITKIMWGAEQDFQCLLYQELPEPLRIRPASVVDAKKSFHDLGLAAMLGHVPRRFLVGLPAKGQIDFDQPHSRNQRAFAAPLRQSSARYAADDLHRIEAILYSKMPASGSYVAARSATEQVLDSLLADPYGVKSFRADLRRLEKRSGAGRGAKAVQLMRHIVSLRRRRADLTGEEQALVDETEANVKTELALAGVCIPDDLSFSKPSYSFNFQ